MSSTMYLRPAPPPAHSAARWTGDRRLPVAEEVTPYSQGALALTFPLPSGLDCEPRSTALTLVQQGSWRSADPSESQVWAARFLQAVVEVLSSDRPLTQLVRWTDSVVYADIGKRRQRLAQRAAPASRAGRPHVATVHVCHPTDSTAEIAARVTMGGRSRAVAARLDRRNERWLCTAIQFG